MNGATMFSGIRAPEVAMPWVKWKWAADIAKFPNAVGRKRFKNVPNLGDVTAPDFIARTKLYGPIDLLVFGSPCQSYSVAGKRLGLDDPRGNLALVALRIVAAIRPRWFLFENVPGLLSSGDSRDFGSLLGTVEDIGYFVSSRVLDAQYFGVPQRRRRIFALGHFGDWRYPTAVLFEPESLSRNSAPRRKTREEVTGTLVARAGGGGGFGTDFECDGGLTVAMCPNTKNNRLDGESQTFVAHSLRADGFDASREGLDPTLRSMPGGGGNHPAVAFQEAQTGCREYAEARTLRANGPGNDPVGTRIRDGMEVRRLTPMECARLQGFPDTFCHIYRNKKRKITKATATYYRNHGLKCFFRHGQWYTLVAADGPIYKAYGNSMAIPTLRWIGDRLQKFEKLLAVAGEQA